MALSPETTAGIAIAVAAGSEIIALSPLRANSWVQLTFQVLGLLFPRRR